ncbi:pseudoazurin [uncultured Litoreibacter sp.]|uniref:pseudoazurin n=1 Tax=uncultured Litoreibacter sp. TaxID=1392394 RepID=UPI002609F284|nr:pseudoazurin [uncultured Litoreibacter sp.]
MPMLNTRLRSTAIAALMCTPALPAAAEEFEILMLNTAAENAQHTNVFAPDILRIQLGDTVTFIPTDKGHNTASKRGMIPQRAEPWNSPMDEKFSLTLTVPGVYGYICLPHYEMGMVGLIIVGDEMQNLDAAKDARQVGSARGAFRDLFARAEGSQ